MCGARILNWMGRNWKGQIYIIEKNIREDRIYKFLIFFLQNYTYFFNVFEKLKGPGPPSPLDPSLIERTILFQKIIQSEIS
jgi:hypothetical protein